MNYVEPIRDNNKLEDILKYLKKTNKRNYMLFCLGLYTGLRISDILKLQVKHVKDKDSIRIKEKKTNKSKVIRIGIENVGTHSLRKTFGYNYYNKTKNIAVLQNIFNHSEPSITLRYIGINQDTISDAYESMSYF